MVQMLGEVPKGLNFHHCRFPTSARRDIEQHHYESVSVFEHEKLGAGLEKNFGSLEELVQCAWAILMRSYLQDNTVTFAVLFDGQNIDTFKYRIKESPFSADTEALVLQYHVPDSCRLIDIHATACWKSARQALKETQINTAINLLASPSSPNGPQDGQLSQLRGPQQNIVADDFDLTLNLNPTQSLSDVSISYRCPSISRQYAHAVANTLRMIIKHVIFNGECKVGQLDLVSEEDKQKTLSWNPKPPYAQMNCMHYLVEATVRAIPVSDAVCAWDGSLTYAQLDELSSIAAQRLVQAGVDPGDYVPFAYEKSLWTVVATYAILKAGAAFVPLDPTHPKARLEEILHSINASVVVTSDSLASIFKDLGKDVVVISAQTVSVHKQNGTGVFCSAPVGPGDPIFVLFTSGSTGKPKGMIHEHGGICTHAITHGKAMGYHGARVLQFAAHTFDVAIIDIFTTLIFGGCVCIPSEEDRRSNIIGAINNMKADYAILTPSFAGLIDPSEVPTLKTLAIGGEALPQDRLQRWAGKVSLVQIYGPAEVGICLIMYMHPEKTRPETVGYPLRNSLCWLVDPDDPNRLVPIGAVGELVVAGPSLARGYLNNEAKTRACFLDNLAWADFMGLECERFFRTGDLLRYNTDSFDGSYDFVGRKDSQIKLRGQRIEPGEIEHHIANIPGVAVSMVARPQQGCFAGELVAVVQMHGAESSRVRNEPISISPNQSLSIETVKRHLSKALPGYMIPTVCLVITCMPFVPSLKIDRKLVDGWLIGMVSRPSELAVATLANLKASKLDPSEATANELSGRVAELVAGDDKFKRPMLERHDFVLQAAGIDSIQIISLSMFLRKRYTAKIPIDILLSSKVTIRDLARLIDHHNQSLTAPGVLATIDVRRECRFLSDGLFRDIESQYPNRDLKGSGSIQNVFLTGASGYLGSAILHHLMARPNIRVFALVRCLTESAGLQRIIDAAAKTGWWQDCYSSRIHIWQGDLTERNLGLDSQKLKYLHGTTTETDLWIHAIIHNGARVHYSSDYETLKGPNVDSTLTLLKIAASSTNLSTFVYVSGGQKPNARDDENMFSMAAPLGHANGYAQTKFVSGQLVRSCVGHASFRAKRLLTIQPGYIIGSLTAGIANQRDFIWRLIAGCIEVGAYNCDEAAHWLFIADVEGVARAVVSPLFDADVPHPHPSGHIEKVLNGLRFSHLWRLLRDDFGYHLEPLTYSEWMGRLRAAIMAKQERHLLFPLLHVLESDGGTIGSEEVPLPITEEIGDVNLPREVLRRNVKYLIDVGFLPRPHTTAAATAAAAAAPIANGLPLDGCSV